jgi:hypothetical protein
VHSFRIAQLGSTALNSLNSPIDGGELRWYVEGMNSADLTCDQCRAMHKSLFRLANYLSRVVKRMEKTGFPPDDPLYRSARRAYDSVCSLCMELHYLGCKSGVGVAPRAGMKAEG